MTALQQLAEYLNHWPWLNLVLLVLAITAIVLAVAFFIKSRRLKLPVYQVRTFRLIEDKVSKIEGMKILYRDQPIGNLSVSRVALWNRGSEPINDGDIAHADPLRIQVTSGFKLLGAEVSYQTSPANDFSIAIDLPNNTVRITFDYFHRDEGVVLRIYHTGTANTHINVCGTIKGADHPKPFRTEDYLLNATLGRVFRLPEPKVISNPLLRFLYVLVVLIPILILIVIPIGLPIAFVDKVLSLVRRTPRGFPLD